MYMINNKNITTRLTAAALSAVFCLGAAGCTTSTPAKDNTPAPTVEITEFANGKGLGELVPEKIALAIGGNGIVKGMGFLKNYYCITEQELAQAVGDTSLIPESLGGAAAWQQNLLYSAYDNHGAAQYGYHRVSGINLQMALSALGVDTTQPIAVEAKSFDGFSKTLDDAFGVKDKRSCYLPSGEVMETPSPVLAFSQTKVVADAPGNAGELPEAAGSEVTALPLFVFGQTAQEDENNCSYVSGTAKIRTGMDSPAFALESAQGITSISVSDIALLGRYNTEYSYTDEGVKTHQVTGIPLTVLLAHWEVSPTDTMSIQLFTADSAEAVRTLAGEEIARAFVAIDASENGVALENSTSVRLYCPGSTKAEVVVANLVKGIVA